MISTVQWRATIGCFSPRRKIKNKCRGSLPCLFTNIRSAGISLCLRLSIALSLVIIACGDVEQNPGPDFQDVMTELRDLRSSIDSQFASLKEEIVNLKSDLLHVKDSVRKVKADIDGVYDDLYHELSKTKERLCSLESKLENQERYSRRDNVILYDVLEEENETQATTKQKVIDILNENATSKIWTDLDFVRLHRLKTKSSGNQPIIIRTSRSSDKFQIISSRSRLKQKGIGVGNDLTPAQRDELKKLKAEGKRGFFINGQLRIDPSGTSSQNHSDQDRDDRSSQSQPASSGRSLRSQSTTGRGRGRGGYHR